MYFPTWLDAVSMQGHGQFVWPAFILSVALLGGYAAILRVRSRRLVCKLKRQYREAANDASAA